MKIPTYARIPGHFPEGIRKPNGIHSSMSPSHFSLSGKGDVFGDVFWKEMNLAQALCKRPCADLLRSSHHQTGRITEGSGVLHSLRRTLLTKPGPHLQPEEKGGYLDTLKIA